MILLAVNIENKEKNGDENKNENAINFENQKINNEKKIGGDADISLLKVLDARLYGLIGDLSPGKKCLIFFIFFSLFFCVYMSCSIIYY